MLKSLVFVLLSLVAANREDYENPDDFKLRTHDLILWELDQPLKFGFQVKSRNPDYVVRQEDTFLEMRTDQTSWAEPLFNYTLERREPEEGSMYASVVGGVVRIPLTTCDISKRHRISYRLKQGKVLHKGFRIKVRGC